MKNLSITIAFILLVSCTSDNVAEKKTNEPLLNNTAYRLLTLDLEIAKAEFREIITSEFWIAHKTATKNFARNLNGENVNLNTLKNRNLFHSFIIINLSKTRWSSIVAAMAQYDEIIATGKRLNNATSNFILSLTDVTLSDIEAIFYPAISNPIYSTTSSPCH